MAAGARWRAVCRAGGGLLCLEHIGQCIEQPFKGARPNHVAASNLRLELCISNTCMCGFNYCQQISNIPNPKTSQLDAVLWISKVPLVLDKLIDPIKGHSTYSYSAHPEGTRGRMNYEYRPPFELPLG